MMTNTTTIESTTTAGRAYAEALAAEITAAGGWEWASYRGEVLIGGLSRAEARMLTATQGGDYGRVGGTQTARYNKAAAR